MRDAALLYITLATVWGGFSLFVEFSSVHILIQMIRVMIINLLLTDFPLILSRDQDMSWVAHYSMFFS